jgi:hypothetical protein
MPLMQEQESLEVVTQSMQGGEELSDEGNTPLFRLLTQLATQALRPLADRVWLVRGHHQAALLLPAKEGSPQGTLVPISEEAANVYKTLVQSPPLAHEQTLAEHLRKAQIPSRLARRALESLSQSLIAMS